MTQEILSALGQAPPDPTTESDAMPGTSTGPDTVTRPSTESDAMPGTSTGPDTVPRPSTESDTVSESSTAPDANRNASTAPDALRAISTHYRSLQEQAARIPGFDLAAALREPDFVRLTAPGVGVSVEDAWYALHRRERQREQEQAARRALSRAVSAGAQRPREGGGSGAATLSVDYRSLPRARQTELKQRILRAAARGEKIYP